MKKGFTLAEALITLGIIGIVAALTLPAINSTRPDAKKVKYLKTYDAICEVVKSLASNSKEYPSVGKDKANSATAKEYDLTEYPLLNMYTSVDNADAQSISAQKVYNGVHKFCKLLAWGFNAEGNEQCSNNSATLIQRDPSDPGDIYFNESFITNSGVIFSVNQRERTLIREDQRSTFGMNVIIDINGAEAPNCVYDSNNCKNPDRFWFFVEADGNVIPADSMGQYYIETRKSPRMKVLKDEDLPPAKRWENCKTPLPVLTKIEAAD